MDTGNMLVSLSIASSSRGVKDLGSDKLLITGLKTNRMGGCKKRMPEEKMAMEG
jgi:hypothetical protein